MHSLLKSVFVGVGNNPDPIPLMRGADAVCWNTVPLRIIPARGQVSENFSHPETKQPWRVLHDDELGSKLANESVVFRPKATSGGFQPPSFAGEADILAWEAATDAINGNSVSFKNVCCEGSNVMIAGHLRPMFRQDAAGKFLDLAEGYRLEAASTLKPKAQASKPAEKIEHLKLVAHARLLAVVLGNIQSIILCCV